MKVDFLRPNQASASGLCWLAFGLISLPLALWFHTHRAEARAAQAAIVQARELALAQERVAAQAPVRLSRTDQRLQQIASELRQPWLQTLRLIENVTKPPIYLIRVSIDPTSGLVRMDGEAPTFAEALEFAHSLDDGTLIGPGTLQSHETVVDPASGASVIRFSVATPWRAQ